MGSYARIASVAFPLCALATAGLAYLLLSSPTGGATPRSASTIRDTSLSANPPAALSAPATNASAAFNRIYREALWGENDAGFGTSGLGSTLAATELYRRYLQTFLEQHRIKSVVDAGCGDWEFSKAMDWSGVDYRGLDIVPAVIAADKAKYERPNVHFAVANIATDDLPPADLLIVKHVLQHLPNADIWKVIEKFGGYRHVLITSSVYPQSLSSDNRDIGVGGFRPFDPTAAPFELKGGKDLTWWDGHHMQQVVHLEIKSSNVAP